MSKRDRVIELLRNGVTRANVHRPCLALAPIAAVTHAGFRSLVAEHGGCDLYWTEMTSSEGLVNGTPFESYYLENSPEPASTVFQLVGYSRQPIRRAAEIAIKHGFVGIDLNLSCSAPHIVRKGGGIAWMARRDATLEMIDAVRQRLPDATLSVKLRLGMSETYDLASFCGAAAERGVDFVTLHPKLQKEGALRRARWPKIAELRRSIDLPVIGSGGVLGWDTLQARIGTAGEGPVMIGRGAIRAPWLFAYLDRRWADTGYRHRVDLGSVLQRFHELLETYQPTEFLATRARRFYPYFFANYRFGTRIGARLSQAEDYAAAKAEAERFVDEHREESQYTETR